MMKIFPQSPTQAHAEQLKKANIYPFSRVIESTDGSRVTVNSREEIMISSNNYLGLTHHPHVREAAIKAIEKFGTGCTGSRFMNGNLSIHEELEEKLAKYLGHEKAMVFATGMQCNLGAIPAICGPRDCILSDSENHASIIDAIRLARGTSFTYKHSNMEFLEELLASNCNRFKNVSIVTDGVFSVTGEVAKLPEIVKLAKKYGALVYLDDAHGIGVLGDRGRGTMNHFGLTDDVTVNMGTFSKSFASAGGVVSGSAEVIDTIHYNARSFIFSAALPPAAVATVLACLELVLSDSSIYEKLWSNVAFMQKGFKDIGFYTFNSQTPIISIFIGDDLKSIKVTHFLRENGIFATPFIPPAVPKGEALIRTSYMSTHHREDLTKVLEIFKRASKIFQIPTGMH